LCLLDAQGERFAPEIERFVNDTVNQVDLGIAAPMAPELTSFARDLARGAWQERGEYDRQLTVATPDWTIKRMPPVDRNVLRLGLHELLHHPETPPQVVINEAIELARRFGDAESPGFINGVLDSIRQSLGIATQHDANH
jgi:N utilization substance protein B